MKARLKIQNFGPIDDLDIEISKFNILIGPHASGKSTISKVLCVLHSFADFFSTGVHRPKHASLFSTVEDQDYIVDEKYIVVINLLTNYRIENFLLTNTYFYFKDDIFTFELNEKKVTVRHNNNENINRSESYYIPAERIALPMISESLFELTLAQSTLPAYFLQFGKDFTTARRYENLFNIPLLNVEFAHREGRNVVILRDNKSLLLEETYSAIQANLPLLVILQFPVKAASLFVIEELELHGFPILQKGLLYYFVERMNHPKLQNAYVMLPTHSPYILSAANNLLFAAKVAKQDQSTAAEVNKIISKASWIEKEDFSAFYLNNGKATSIINAKTGLIDENELDGISEDLSGEFDALMDLYKPVVA